MAQKFAKQRCDQRNKPFLDVLQGGKSKRVPFWFMRQAGRYLPEYRALRASKNGFLDMAMDVKAATEVTLQPIRRYGMDAAIIFSDILVIPYALGQSLDFVAGEGPKLDPIRDGEVIAKLHDRDFEAKLTPVYEALSQVRFGLRSEGFNQTALIGFAGSPWTVATYMVEGGSSKDFLNTKIFAALKPDEFQKLIDILVHYTSIYLIKQIEAGAESVQLFDSWAGVLDEESFERWVIAPNKEIVKRVRAAHPQTPIIGFPKGAGQNYSRYVEQTGVSAVGLDTQMSLKWAVENLQNLVPLQGNLDPVLLLIGGKAMEEGVLKILDELSGGPFIFNLGHGIIKETPPEHVEHLSKLIKDYPRS